MYVEGLESGIFYPDLDDKIKEETPIKDEKVAQDVEQLKVKQEVSESSTDPGVKIKCETSEVKMETDSNLKLEKSMDISMNDSYKMDTSDISKSEENGPIKFNIDQELKTNKNNNSTIKEESLGTDYPKFNGCLSEMDKNMKCNRTKSPECNANSKSDPESESSTASKDSFNPFIQQSTNSSKLSDLCSTPPSSSSEQNDSSSKSIMNGIPPTSSPLITPYSSAPSLFFQPSSAMLPSHMTTTSSPHPLPAHQHPKTSTPTGTESKSSFLSIDTMLKKDSSPPVPHNQFLSSALFPTMSAVSPDHMMQSYSKESAEQKPWFSILPRMPCDDLSLTSSQVSFPFLNLISVEIKLFNTCNNNCSYTF